jgi:hypothetical protein
MRLQSSLSRSTHGPFVVHVSRREGLPSRSVLMIPACFVGESERYPPQLYFSP